MGGSADMFEWSAFCQMWVSTSSDCRRCLAVLPDGCAILPFFPHHIHMAEEKEVRPGRLLSTIEVVDVIARELAVMFGDND